jgi:hypothetical protein
MSLRSFITTASLRAGLLGATLGAVVVFAVMRPITRPAPPRRADTPPPPIEAPIEAPSEARSEAERMLDRHLLWCDATATVEEAIDLLRRQTGADIAVEWDALERFGVRRDKPIRVYWRDATLADGLATILEAASGSPGSVGFTPRGRSILISDAQNLTTLTFIRSYDVRDLAAARQAASAVERTDWESGLVATLEGYLGGTLRARIPASLVWIACFDGRLIVRHDGSAHRDTVQFLRQLRSPPAATVGRPPGMAGRVIFPATSAVDLALARAVPEFRLDGVPFEEALDAVRALSDGLSEAELWVDWQELGAAGFDRRRPVTVRLRNATVGRALSAVLAAAGDTGLPLDYMPVGEGLCVTTLERMESTTYPRIYDVRDLLAGDALVVDPAAAAPPARATRESSVELLCRLVMDQCEDHGEALPFSEWDGRLIVRQNWRTHRRIEAMLDALRSRAPAPATAPTSAAGKQN